MLTFVDAQQFAQSPMGDVVAISGTDGRRGSPYRHVAFVPHPLGDEPKLSSQTWRAVANARAALAKLDQASQQVRDPGLLRRPSLAREAHSTSALEGTFAPLEDVLAAETMTQRSGELTEVVNYMLAANFAYDDVMLGRKISLGLLETVHRTLVRGTVADTDQAGRIRTIQVAIGSPSGAIEDSRFVPMPPGVALTAAIRDTIDWVHSNTSLRDPVVSAAMAHYQFETVHPFNDGNGRVGRMLIVLQFLADGVLTQPILSISTWLEARRYTYQDLLAEVSATGDWDAWIGFFAEGVRASALDVASRVDRLWGLQQRFRSILDAAGVKGLAVDIAHELISTPVVTIAGLAKRFGKSNPATSTAVAKLVELGILRRPDTSYARQFVAPDVMAAALLPFGSVLAADAPLARESNLP
jgi:Fic family protein